MSQDKSLKVTDRRMFTPDGDLREEYKTLLETAKDEQEAAAEIAEEPVAAEPETADEPEPELESGARFHDLVGLLAQSASVYLQQASQRVEERSELLDMARLHIDLLALLKHRTRGNLQSDEAAVLDDALSQLRMAFVRYGG
ncbi:MAG: DUF1844 domain-containing protein [Acidobacteriota bacterium]